MVATASVIFLLFVPLAHPALTPRDFFLWGFVNNRSCSTIDNAMLGRVWQELDYRLDVCRVTNGAHIEHH